jgi:hypothetical protein
LSEGQIHAANELMYENGKISDAYKKEVEASNTELGRIEWIVEDSLFSEGLYNVKADIADKVTGVN